MIEPEQITYGRRVMLPFINNPYDKKSHSFGTITQADSPDGVIQIAMDHYYLGYFLDEHFGGRCPPDCIYHYYVHRMHLETLDCSKEIYTPAGEEVEILDKPTYNGGYAGTPVMPGQKGVLYGAYYPDMPTWMLNPTDFLVRDIGEFPTNRVLEEASHIHPSVPRPFKKPRGWALPAASFRPTNGLPSTIGSAIWVTDKMMRRHYLILSHDGWREDDEVYVGDWQMVEQVHKA